MLHEIIVQELRSIQSKLHAEEKLPTAAQLTNYYTNFRERFGIEQLQSMDGEALLVHMHGLFRDNRNTMVYWLEFKNDEEFPSIFGSISGGSALKFGVYPSAQTGDWMGRDAGNNHQKISTEEAIEIARQHREQLIKGCALLAELPHNGSDHDYRQLQARMGEVAPDVSNTAWGHKYFSLLFPNKLDDYHVERYQRFHLVRLLDIPPAEKGHYVAAGRYVNVASELGMPINHLTTLLNERTPQPYQYWRLITSYTNLGDKWENWPKMRDGGFLAIGLANVGDLTDVFAQPKSDIFQKLEARLEEEYGQIGRWAREIYNCLIGANDGDLILAIAKNEVAGIGRILGPYYHVDGENAPHRRPVEWLSIEDWNLLDDEGKGSTFREIRTFANQTETERRILESVPSVVGPVKPSTSTGRVQLSGIPGRIQQVLERKGQVILYGPPGTGKTYWAERAARDLAARHNFGAAYDELPIEQQEQVICMPNAFLRFCAFHPGYGYEDFLEGYRPHANEGELQFALYDGIFKHLCQDAATHRQHQYYLIIDEINRGDIPRILGELMTLLEKDKRGKTMLLPLSQESFQVPPNVHVIGTMNTAGRSIALLDTALRRRFGFMEFLPNLSLFEGVVVDGLPLGIWLRELNRRIIKFVGHDARNLQIGHAYLMEDGLPIDRMDRFASVLREDIIPLLEEYCYEDYTILEQVLGKGLVDIYALQIRNELFQRGREAELIQALLEPTPDLSTTLQEDTFNGVGDVLEDDEEVEAYETVDDQEPT